MNGLTWSHIATIAIGAAVAVVGAFAPPAALPALLSLGTGIVTGALGHAQGSKEKKE